MSELPAAESEGDPYARLLLDLVAALQAPYALEKSIRLCHQALLPNRFLATFAKSTMGPRADERVLELARRLGMSPNLLVEVERHLPLASAVHLGYEQNQTSRLYKLYVEFRQVEGIQALDPRDPIPQHLAFKWDAVNPQHYVTSRYMWHPSVSYPDIDGRFDDIYMDPAHVEARGIARGILRLASHRIPSPGLHYLEVAEDGNARRSFDLNLYDGGFRVSDLFPFLKWMCQQYAIPPTPFMKLYERIDSEVLGHVAGGIHREGETFFNIYFGARSGPNLVPTVSVSTTNSPKGKEPAGLSSMVVSAAMSPPFAQGVARVEPELTEPDDHYFNYCLWPYEPISATLGKFRPVNLLLHSFERACVLSHGSELVDTLRRGVGPFQTVWGVKWMGGRTAWEFYFYDYKRLDRELSLTRVLEVLRPFTAWPSAIDERVPYFMFSIDIDELFLSKGHNLGLIHLYLGNPGSTVSSGISYALTAEHRELENLYYFFQAPRDLEAAANKIACSAHVEVGRVGLDQILWPELRKCHTICVANKRENDTVYFSGVNVNQLLFFLERLAYPPETIGHIRQHRTKLDHLLFDVGFDYVGRDDSLFVLKSGYYGIF
jgi:hypothetical protein